MVVKKDALDAFKSTESLFDNDLNGMLAHSVISNIDFVKTVFDSIID